MRPLTFLLPPSLGHAKASARAELIEAALGRALGTIVNTVVATSYAELEASTLAGSHDMVWCPSAVCSKLTTVGAIFTIVRDGRSEYRSAIIARKSDELALATLARKRAAWVDPLSAGGYLLAMATLRVRAIDPDRAFSSQSFLGSHRAVALAVLDGTADVGAVSAHGASDEAIMATLEWYVGAPAKRLEAIALTESCPNDAIVLTHRLPPEAARAIEKDLSGEDARGRLSTALEAERLDRGSLADYQRAFGLLAAKSSQPPSR